MTLSLCTSAAVPLYTRPSSSPSDLVTAACLYEVCALGFDSLAGGEDVCMHAHVRVPGTLNLRACVCAHVRTSLYARLCEAQRTFHCALWQAPPLQRPKAQGAHGVPCAGAQSSTERNCCLQVCAGPCMLLHSYYEPCKSSDEVPLSCLSTSFKRLLIHYPTQVPDGESNGKCQLDTRTGGLCTLAGGSMPCRRGGLCSGGTHA